MKLFDKYKNLSDFKNLFKKKVVRNLLTVGFITLFLKGLGFFKESVVAASFGLSEVLDTFFIAFLVPGFIMNVFIGAFKSVFIPNYIAELRTGNSISSFQGTGFLVTICIASLFTLIAFLFTDVYLENFFPGQTADYYNLIKSHFQYLLPCIIFWGLSSILSGLLNINNEFKLSTFSNIFIPLAIIVCLLLFRPIFGNMVLAIGTLIGTIAAFLYLLITCMWKKIIHIATPDLRNANAKLMFAQVPAKVSSGFLTGMNGVVDQFFAAQLAVGSIAALNYGNKMPAFLRGILVVATTSVLLPYFSKMILANRKRTFNHLFKTLKLIFLIAGIFAVIGILLSDFLVALFFERKEFTEEDTKLVANVQKIFLIYIPFTIAAMVVVNFLTSINKNTVMAYISFVALVLNIVLDYILIQYYGVFGIALCTTMVIIIKDIALIGYAYTLSKRELN